MTTDPRFHSASASSPEGRDALDAKLVWLRQPAAYPDATDAVEAIETHMSWVFLTTSHAYKLKKAVRYAYLDFSTLAARQSDCEAEVRLNRRLAGNVYEGVAALTRDASGRMRVGGAGEVVDWLVVMRRLPRACMLDRMIGQGTVVMSDVVRLARRLADFYASLAAEPVSARGYRQALAARIDETRRELGRPEFGLDARRADAIAGALDAWLRHHAATLDDRVARGRIVEGHGDLRPEHVCLQPEPVVIDCLEFRREFRILDAIDEVSYLALECERLDAPAVAVGLLEAYAETSGDVAPDALVDFYQAARALLRAKLSVWHLGDDGRHPPETWIAQANAYLALAAHHAAAARH